MEKLPREYTPGQLKAAYKSVLLKYHPDKNPNVTSDQFQELTQINAVLSSKEKALLYDRFGPFKQ